MYLQGKRVDLLTLEDIQRVINNKVQESRSLDYKLELKLKQDADKKEFLFDISSMANTEGGCFIYGIEETKDEKKQNTGTPERIVGIIVENLDKLKQQIEDLIKGNTDPNISYVAIQPVTIEGKLVLVIGVSKTIGLPVMVTFNETNKFYKRRNSGKYPVDVYELKQLFMQSLVWKQSAENFRTERIRKVLDLRVFPNLQTFFPFFIHLVPFTSQDDILLDLTAVDTMPVHTHMRPIKLGAWDRMFNLDGYASWNGKAQAPITSYDQLFRNGIYEVYTSSLINKMTFNNGQELMAMNGLEFIREVTRKVNDSLQVLRKLQVEPPFVLMISLLNTQNVAIFMENLSNWTRPFLTNEVFLPNIVIPTFETNVQVLLKPLFDIVWQCVSENQSPA